MVKAKRGCAQPNEGFMNQLRLFESMGCTLDVDFKPLKLYKLTGIHNYVKHAKVLPSNIRMWNSEEKCIGMAITLKQMYSDLNLKLTFPSQLAISRLLGKQFL